MRKGRTSIYLNIKKNYIRFSGKVIVSHLLTVLKKQRKLLDNYGMLYSIMILKRRDRL